MTTTCPSSGSTTPSAAAVAFLGTTGRGVITLDEFSDRVGQVYPRHSADIEVVTRTCRRRGEDDDGRGDDVRTLPGGELTVSIFSSTQRKGRWRSRGTDGGQLHGHANDRPPPGRGVGDEITITASRLLGGVDVIVPEGSRSSSRGSRSWRQPVSAGVP